MARGNTWTNADGLIVGFATRDSFNVEDSQVHTLGHKMQAEVRFTADNASALAAGVVPTGKEFELPAGAVVTGGSVILGDAAFNAVTSITIGQRDATTGATVNADGYLLSKLTAVLLADAVFPLDGDAVDTVMAVDTVLELVQVGGDATTGDITVLIEYIVPHADQAAPAVIVGEI